MWIKFYNIRFRDNSSPREDVESEIDYPEEWHINDVYDDIEIHGEEFLTSGFGKEVSNFNFRVMPKYHLNDNPICRNPRYIYYWEKISEISKLLACELEDFIDGLGNDYHIVDSFKSHIPSYAIYKNINGKEFFWIVDVLDEGLSITIDMARIKHIVEKRCLFEYHYDTNDFPNGIGTVFNPFKWSLENLKQHIVDFNCELNGYTSLNPKWKLQN